MATESEIVQALEGLPPAVLEQVKDFIGFLKEKNGPRRLPQTERRVAKAQLAAIKKWAGAVLAQGFSGREHDTILYGNTR